MNEKLSNLKIQTKEQLDMLIEAFDQTIWLMSGILSELWNFSTHPNKSELYKLQYEEFTIIKNIMFGEKSIHDEITEEDINSRAKDCDQLQKRFLDVFEVLNKDDYPVVFDGLSDHNLQTIMFVCEKISRLYMGQIEEIFDFVPDNRYVEVGQYRFGKEIRNLKAILFGELHPHGYWSIHSPEIPDTARNLYDIYAVIRFYLSWRDEENTPDTRDWSKQMTVNYDKPMHFGKMPLVEVKEKENINASRKST